MKQIIIVLFIITCAIKATAQKNVVPARQTQMLGIQLPDGSKQDKRFLSVVAAGTFLSMATEFKNFEFTPVEVYSIPSQSGFTIENIKGYLTASGYGIKVDHGDNKLMWFSRENSNWIVCLSQEVNETNLYIGQGNPSQSPTKNTSQPVYLASTNPVQSLTSNTTEIHPTYIPPLAGRQTGPQQQSMMEKEAGMMVYDLDSNLYHVIKIGEQYWLKENLRTTQYNDTTLIPTGLNAEEWSKTKHGAYAVYDNKPGNIKKYGFLYNGYAAASGRLCPKGWHVATDADWKELERFLGVPETELEKTGERGDIAAKLKTPDDWSSSVYTNNNSSGFSVVPAGSRLDNGEYTTLNQYGNFWTSTVYDDRYGLLYLWNHHVHYNTNAVGRIYTIANNGYSCRCVKDK